MVVDAIGVSIGSLGMAKLVVLAALSQRPVGRATGIQPDQGDAARRVDLLRETAHRSRYVDCSVVLAVVESGFRVTALIAPEARDQTAVVDAFRRRRNG